MRKDCCYLWTVHSRKRRRWQKERNIFRIFLEPFDLLQLGDLSNVQNRFVLWRWFGRCWRTLKFFLEVLESVLEELCKEEQSFFCIIKKIRLLTGENKRKKQKTLKLYWPFFWPPASTESHKGCEIWSWVLKKNQILGSYKFKPL